MTVRPVLLVLTLLAATFVATRPSASSSPVTAAHPQPYASIDLIDRSAGPPTALVPGCSTPTRASIIDIDPVPTYVTPPIEAGVAFLPDGENEYRYLESHGIEFTYLGHVPFVAQLGPFDLDGDGTRDFLVSKEFYGSGPVLYAVSGRRNPGTYEVTKVGVRLPDDWSTTGVRHVGDQDHDGSDDLLVGARRLYRGASLLASGPGTSVDPPLWRLIDGLVWGESIVDFHDGYGATLLVIKQVDETTAEISVGLDGPKLTTAGRPLYRPVGEDPTVFGLLGDGDRPFVSFAQGTGEGSASAYWVWDLFGPCWSRSTAAAAEAQPGRPSLTG